MVEDKTGTILYAKSPDTLIEPAALAKLMTMEVVFHQLKTGKLTPETQYTVSENAWRTGGAPSGGSTMFAKLKSSISVADLIQGVIVQSANDGCIILAEGIAGSEPKFAEMMNTRAKEIGLKNANFVNSTGLPDPQQRISLTRPRCLGAPHQDGISGLLPHLCTGQFHLEQHFPAQPKSPLAA